MNVVFRVDASLLIGSGHVMRCLVLADELERAGHRCVFACTPLEGDMRAFITDSGFSVVTLAAPKTVIQAQSDADYGTWLQKTIEDDAKNFLEKVHSADLVVTDHYAIGKKWQSKVVQSINCRLLAIDDLAREHCADLVLDQTLGRSRGDYSSSSNSVLAGSEYALLKPAFSRLREEALSRALPTTPIRILVSMGGVDAPNATLEVLKSLCSHVQAHFTVLLSRRAPHYKQVSNWCKQRYDVTHLDFVSDMATLMLEHDVAIGAPGTSSWERACLGLPNIIVPLADNQTLVSEQLVKYGAAVKVDLENISTEIQSAYEAVCNDWHEMKGANLALCDGLGVRRVTLEMEQLFSSNREHLSLVRATPSDIETVYHWQCHPKTREYALNPRVPTWSEHSAWMEKKLRTASDYFYMVTHSTISEKVGVLRLDRIEPNHYLVSIFVNPECYGQGIATQALQLIDALHPELTLHATVLKANSASKRLFENARYQQVDEENYIRKPIC
ncbi:UDP-2,4-diacetamido-2,4,6-trideoxy-beta-L-altropyranose hydrolase [Vibrio sp. B1Z05]|uniref:UDP-2,4-diacetamido-2,4, 6-trideoxy-beta-L-altropyranose hydrolase n=1 Tax=Vibrio sp. B1Z05 TaxID=2654980 RepID=UPI00128C8C7D|nr:UDP-2,4-diacetamido-2,4,6-trideoxy-beta-L-altropyranose hydrolase [Vibrio sp. B1Z05]MPW36241.1 UDP-2,4-diacetamido-2,4,6-trideoxy-beta-L-altropyranose hydrolase [Vibrio sp. B1Z05]